MLSQKDWHSNMVAIYEGKEPYIFVSYAHKDAARVIPAMEGLAAQGFRIWYDAGIEAGTEWPEYIAEHLRDSGCVLAFLSETSLASVNCRQEINLAINKQKPLLVAHLEQCEMSIGMQMRLDMVQAIYRDRHPDDYSFVDALARAQILQPCKTAVTPTITAKATVWTPSAPHTVQTTPATNENSPQALYDRAKQHDIIAETEKAFALYLQAAEQGHVDAMYEVGLSYDLGEGVTKDYTQAAIWYEKAAMHGQSQAQFGLGQLYEDGNGVTSNLEQAFAWYKKAAEQGHVDAQDKLGFSYCFGVGVDVDEVAAKYWWKMAADNGSVTAGISLGTFFPDN